MDNNVSKETFLHKFFLVPVDDEKKPISIENLLQLRLLSIFDLYCQQRNIIFPDRFVRGYIPGKIVLLDAAIDSKTLNKQDDSILFLSRSKIIVYASSAFLAMAAHLHKKPRIIAEEWNELWDFELKNINATSHLEFNISIQKSGWIYFYLQSKSLTAYLRRSLDLLFLNTTDNITQIKRCEVVATDLFPLQYTHSRCCSLLRLAIREKIISHYREIAQIDWLDNCDREAEIYLLRQLFLIADSFHKETVNWQKLAADFSQTVMVFLGECRFLGAVRQENPKLAVARLGSIALSQYWLQRILIEKFNISAPTDL